MHVGRYICSYAAFSSQYLLNGCLHAVHYADTHRYSEGCRGLVAYAVAPLWLMGSSHHTLWCSAENPLSGLGTDSCASECAAQICVVNMMI
jgi:hypothetical protein